MNEVLWGNPIRSWIIGIGVAVVVLLALIIIRRRLVRWFGKWAHEGKFGVHHVVARFVRGASVVFFIALAIYLGSLFLPHLHPAISHGLKDFLILSVFYQLGLVGQTAINLFLQQTMGRANERISDTALIGFSLLGKVALWTIVVLVSLENLGVNMTTLVASLGVGGIAVGLAMQRVVADLIASLAIVMDKPFSPGDYIGIDTLSGTVEKIGLKTTRLRSLTGEELVISNTDLISGRIHNYKNMRERRIVFAIGVTYDTPADKLERIPGMVKEIIDEQTDVRFDRAHFKDLGAFSLDFEIVYYVTIPDYLRFMDIQQAINLALVRRFAAAEIEFAFPTQTLFVQGTSTQSEVTTSNSRLSVEGPTD